MSKRQNFKRPLTALKVSRELFDKIMSNCNVEFVDDIGLYRNGYKDKKICRAVKDKYVICTGAYLNLFLDKKYNDNNGFDLSNDKFTGWKQYVCTLREDLLTEFEEDFAPYVCTKIVNDQLHKEGLNDDDIEERLCSYQEEYDPKLKQIHIENVKPGIIQRFDNCYYYDINKAHSYALGIIFPELEDWLKKIAKYSKKNKKWKSVPNYYVGSLAQKTREMRTKGLQGKHERTYNWIVHNTTKKLLERINECTEYDEYGLPTTTIVYANTDGVVLQNPSKVIESSNKFGEFKLETDEHTFYTYAGDNYYVIQYGDTVKGNLPNSLKNLVDLRKGKVISYKRVREGNVFKYIDIEEKYLDIEVV